MIVITAGPSVLHMPHFDRIVALIDVFGLGAYAIVGLESLPLAGAQRPGRDFRRHRQRRRRRLAASIILRRTPELLEPGAPITIVAVTGCAAYAVMTRLATLPEGLAGLLAIGLVLLIRTAALRLGLRTAPISGFAPPDDE